MHKDKCLFQIKKTQVDWLDKPLNPQGGSKAGPLFPDWDETFIFISLMVGAQRGAAAPSHWEESAEMVLASVPETPLLLPYWGVPGMKYVQFHIFQENMLTKR